MKRISIIMFITIFSCLLLSACTKKYEKEDIEEYLQNTIGISKYQLSEKTARKDEEGNEDYYYHVIYKDIEFDVINDYYTIDTFGAQTLTNTLTSNFNEVVKDYYVNHYYNRSNIIYENDLVYHKKNLICIAANEDKEIDENKLKICYDNLLDFISTIDFNSYPITNISVELTNQNTHVKWLSIYKDKKIASFYEFKR